MAHRRSTSTSTSRSVELPAALPGGTRRRRTRSSLPSSSSALLTSSSPSPCSTRMMPPRLKCTVLLMLCAVHLSNSFSIHSRRTASLRNPHNHNIMNDHHQQHDSHHHQQYFCQEDVQSNAIRCWTFFGRSFASSRGTMLYGSSTDFYFAENAEVDASNVNGSSEHAFHHPNGDSPIQAAAATTTATTNGMTNGDATNGASSSTHANGASSSTPTNGANGGTVAAGAGQSLDPGPIADQDVMSSSHVPNILDIARPTENGGYSHTRASRSKISAANKGKTPWNKGKTRSEETRAKIAAGVRARNRERFLQKLKDLGVTEEEYTEQKKAERRRKDAERRARRTDKGGYRPTDETKQKISNILKEKYANGEIKRTPIHPSKVRRGFTHTEETRKKISESLRKRWKDDPEYRQSMLNKTAANNNDEATRQKISETLKKKWQDPEFRAKMMEKMEVRKASGGLAGESHRAKISAAMKAKWQDKEYREKTLNAIAKRSAEQMKLRAQRPPKPRKKKGKKRKVVVGKRKKKKKVVSVKMEMVMPVEVGDVVTRRIVKETQKAKRKKAAAKKKAAKEPLVAPVLVEASKDADIQPVVAATKPIKKPKKKAKKKKAKKKKAKEPDGSVSRLKEERRDLFDLLYGDEDGSATKAAEPEPRRDRNIFSRLGDENLDEFDPYGLDDY